MSGAAGHVAARRHQEDVEVGCLRSVAHQPDDDAETISRKIRKAKTDPDGLPSEVDGLKGRPEADNLVGIYAALADLSKADVLTQFGGQQFSVFKPALVDLAVAHLAPITDEMRP